MMKTLILPVFTFCLLLTACGGKQVFYFNSNANDVLIIAGEQSCYTPCQLELRNSKDQIVTVTYDQELYFHIKGYEDYLERAKHTKNVIGENDSSYKNPRKDIVSEDTRQTNTEREMRSPSSRSLSTAEEVAGVSMLLPALTVTSASAIVFSPTTTTSNVNDKQMAWQYDTNHYYVYLKRSDKYYVLDDSEITHYALSNFPQMQKELFQVEQPFIEGLIALTDVQNVPELIIASNDALEFLDMLTMAKIEKILDGGLDYEQEFSSISEFLWYDESTLRTIFFHKTPQEFSETIADYLEAKRVPLKNE